MHEAADKAGWQHRFRPLDLAVRFDNDWRYGQPDSHDHARRRTSTNLHGVEQGTCVHLGECDIGCPVKARNTLDFNYLAVAKQQGARVLPLHLVRDIRASAGGYEVVVDEIAGGALQPKTFTAPRVIVAGRIDRVDRAAAARARERRPDQPQRAPRRRLEQQRRLPDAGDSSVPRGEADARADDHLRDRSARSASTWARRSSSRTAGFPTSRSTRSQRAAADPTSRRSAAARDRDLLPVLRSIDLVRNVMPWFAQARDAADGTCSLKNGRLCLDWDIAASEETINAVASVHRKLAMLTGGHAADAAHLDDRPGPDHAASARRLQHGHLGGDRRRRQQGRGLRSSRSCTSPTAPSCRRRSDSIRRRPSRRWPSTLPRGSSATCEILLP